MVIRVLVSDIDANGYDYNETCYHPKDKWAQDHCNSYVGFSVNDVNDYDGGWVEEASYDFGTSADAMLFILRWPGSRLLD